MSAPGLEEMTRYLRSAGWTLADEDQRTTLWRPRSPDADDLQLVLPVRENVVDFSDRIQEALKVLAYSERRLPREVIDDIVIGGADSIAVRLTPDLPPGEAPLELAFAAINALRALVVASASAAAGASALVLPNRRSQRAETFAAKARFSTQPGSFVLCLSLPLEDGYPEPQTRCELAGQEELTLALRDPFGRRVSQRMLSAARQAQHLASKVSEGSEQIAAFAERPVANATELAALSALGGPEHDSYQVRFVLSPRSGTTRAPDLFRITPGQQRILKEASEYLRTRQPRTGVTVTGHVIRLARDNGPGPGEVVIHGVDDDTGIARRVRVELIREDYTRALRAHDQGLRVTATGDLDIRGNRRYLRHLTSFSVLSGIDED
ncbi:hypothetical protein EDD29_5304 [Actinocorallia herbida]|uniref:Uncharacterized protein n=2 Tax=Actinocorallia herbida TaxID=58109 RepID=A0A3N1D2B0_9ACTN|nr:hypothetical protein EDD29_5304 [Actinocorallia herbida]